MISKTTREYRLIEQVINNYVIGANGNLELLKSSFLSGAIINGSPIQELYDIVENRGETNAAYHIDFIDIMGGAASVKIVVEDWHGYNFVEFFHLIKTSIGWKITSKTGIGFIETSN